MKPGLSRRQALMWPLALPLVARGAGGLASTEQPPWPAPEPDSRGLMVLLIPGLSLSDVLVPANEGALPNLAGMLQRGLLIEGIVSPTGTVHTLDEVGRELLSSWPYDSVSSACLRWDLGVADSAVPAAICDAPPVDDLASLVKRLRDLVAAGAQGVERSGPRSVVLADDGLLSLQADGMMIDERQPGYSREWAWISAQTWRQALVALDAALGWLLRQLDLSVWSLALISTCSLWPVFAALSLADLQARWRRVLAGGAIAEASADATWPAGGAWAQVETGPAPDGDTGLRLVAPEGYAFVASGEHLPRATPRTGGLFLGVGRGLPGGVRLQPFSPPRLRQLLARLAVETTAAGA